MFTLIYGHDEYVSHHSLSAAILAALQSFGSRVMFAGAVVFRNE